MKKTIKDLPRLWRGYKYMMEDRASDASPMTIVCQSLQERIDEIMEEIERSKDGPII